MQLDQQTINDFQEAVWRHYRENARAMPWREQSTPYFVMVSEVMLQQTQVDRVRPKFLAFVAQFPTIQILAEASLAEVLTMWSGLGYNRRAKFLWQAANMVQEKFGGIIPQTLDELKQLPGIGANTAGAIMAYAYNSQVVFIETNIRTVYFHHFFANSAEIVSDKEIEEILRQTLDTENPREWYWALMDYGTYLKKTVGGRLSQSKHYKKQSPLRGSRREMRGQILRALTKQHSTEAALRVEVAADERFDPALTDLVAEGMVIAKNGQLRLTDH